MALVLRVTCASDGREHLVPEELMTPERAGRYVALCGHQLLAATLTCPPGPSCQLCVAIRKATTASGRKSRRTARPGVWVRLSARLRGRRRSRTRPRHASGRRPAAVGSPPTGGTGAVLITVAGPVIHSTLGGKPPDAGSQR